MRLAFRAALLGLYALLLGPAMAAVQGEKVPAAASTATPTKVDLPEKLEIEREARREAEHKTAIAEAKAELTDTATGRLENWIGLYGIFIAIIVTIAGFFTWRSAAVAARGELMEIRDSIRAIQEDAQKAKAEVDRLSAETADKLRQASVNADHIDKLRANLFVEIPNAPELPAVDPEGRVLDYPEVSRVDEDNWSSEQFRSAMAMADRLGEKTRFVHLARQMAENCENSPSDHAYALFGIAFGEERLGNHERAAEAYADYLAQHPNDDVEVRTFALNNWGLTLYKQAQAKAETNPDEADRLLTLAGEKFAAALSIRPNKLDTLHNWGSALDAHARARAASNPFRADELWDQAGEKYQIALNFQPDMHETLYSWGCALINQAKARASRNSDGAAQLWSLAEDKLRATLALNPNHSEALYNLAILLLQRSESRLREERLALVKQAESYLMRANEHSPGIGSYVLACLAGQRNNAEQAAFWLRDAKKQNAELPSWVAIASDLNFESIRDTLEFQQALKDIFRPV